ncbi:MAG: DUF4445 domain-containing protein [Candidatus Aminicenantes bacterium]|nr:DUF4445 domain-containing protein [Candidatus Aminicenantes bacterium]
MVKKKHTLTLTSHKKTIKAGYQERLSDALLRAGLPMNLFCGGRGVCGKCRVRVVEGRLSPTTENEKTFQAVKHWDTRSRLSCQANVTGDLKISIPPESLVSSVLDPGRAGIPEFPLNPAVKTYLISFHPPTLASPLSLEEICKKSLRKKSIRFVPDVLGKASSHLKDEAEAVYAVLYKDRHVLDIGFYETVYGFAVDLGTTTIVLELVDLVTGKTVAADAFLNPQTRYGADVLSRITYASSPEKNKELQDMVIQEVNRKVSSLIKKYGIRQEAVFEFCISGNTAMNHLFLGLPVQTLASAPYHALFSTMSDLSASSIGLNGNPQARVYIVPNIKSFVGGDITSGLTAVELLKEKGRFLFIDLGTNGEIVLKKGVRFTASSTAAGPAFEGMNLSCGTLAVPGAITKIWHDGKIRFETLDGKKPSGICGSGYIDLLAVLMENGLLDKDGKLLTESKRIELAEKVFLTQKDIRELQLAAAAVKTGIGILLYENRLSPKDLDAVHIGGAFGSYLNIRNAQKIGLIPGLPISKIHFRGNTSLEGCRLFLLSYKTRNKVSEAVSRIRYLSLASHEGFQDRFIRALELG